jgi:hypothetical protein
MVDLGAELRAARPQPPPTLVETIKAEMAATRRRPAVTSFRLAAAGALTAAALAALASVGAIAHAASTVKQLVAPAKITAPASPRAGHAAKRVRHAATRFSVANPRAPQSKSPAEDQYRPGCGLGDKNHVHTGPPGQGGVCPANGKGKKK